MNTNLWQTSELEVCDDLVAFQILALLEREQSRRDNALCKPGIETGARSAELKAAYDKGKLVVLLPMLGTVMDDCTVTGPNRISFAVACAYQLGHITKELALTICNQFVSNDVAIKGDFEMAKQRLGKKVEEDVSVS